MNNRERKSNKSSLLGMGIVVVLLLMESLVGAVTGAGIGGLVITVFILAVAGFVVAFVLAKKKGAKSGSVYSAERSREAAKRIFMREEFEQNEKAVKCTHPRGKEKYFAQLDNFLANGLIDKTEYRVLKERYEKVIIPDNMH